MSQIFILVRKGLLTFRRAKAAILITFGVPIGLIYLFGHVFGIYRKDSGPVGIPLAIVNLSAEPAANNLIDALRREKTFHVITTKDLGKGSTRVLTEADVRAGLHDNEYRYALLIPADLLPANEFGVRLKFLFNPRNEIEAQMVNGILQKTVFSNVPQLLGQSLQKRAKQYLGEKNLERFNRTMANTLAENFGGDREKIYQQFQSGDFGFSELKRRPAAGAKAQEGKESESADIFSRIVNVQTEQVEGKDVKNPMAARLVGGYAVMFLLFAVAGSANTLFEEKNSGVFQRLMASPVKPAHIVWARFVFGVLLGLVQIIALFIAGWVFFGLDIFSHAGALLLVTACTAAACSAFGLLIAAIAPSPAAANGLATFTVISMSAIGGAWFPISFMPSYIQVVSKCTLVYWAVEGFGDVLWAGHSLIDVVPKAGILAAIAAGVMTVAVWRFNRSRLFD